MGLIRRIGRRVVRTWVGSATSEESPTRKSERASTSPEKETSDVSTAEPLEGRAVASRLASVEEVFEAIHCKGGVRIVNHWATWCSGCVEELPLLVELSGRLGSEVEILGVSWDGFQGLVPRDQWVEEVEQCSLEHGLSWGSMVVDGEPDAFFERLGLSCQTVPQVWVVNQEGHVVHRVDQPIDRLLLEQILSWVAEL
ncbi:MAG: TlpA disulfide reductase family protein [Myxococcota bacterium]|nr:TlpA disulfide reductase family protein [Myxococcota bacterium]